MQFNIFRGVLLTVFADFGFAHLLGFFAQFGHNLDLDRQTVTIPAGNIWSLKARHRFVLDDKILEHLVDDMAHVNIAVGIRRAVMQHIQRRIFTGGHDFIVDRVLFPGLPLLRLALGQVRLHRKTGLRQIQCIAISLFLLFIRHVVSFYEITKSPWYFQKPFLSSLSPNNQQIHITPCDKILPPQPDQPKFESHQPAHKSTPALLLPPSSVHPVSDAESKSI